MKTLVISTTIGASLILLCTFAHAAVPANAPAGTTGLCKDGSYYSGPTKKGACKGHKGVKDWYGTPAAAAAGSAPVAASKPAPATAPAAPTAGSAVPKAASPVANPATQVAVAPGGGAGKVWVNISTKVYHCAGDKWYGKTKGGEYMPEAQATAQGFRPDHGKACKA
jgi:hypothetical protein